MVGKEPIISVAANFKQVTGSYLDRRTPNNIVPAICLKVTILFISWIDKCLKSINTEIELVVYLAKQINPVEDSICLCKSNWSVYSRQLPNDKLVNFSQKRPGPNQK